MKNPIIKKLTDLERKRWSKLNQTIKQGLDQMLTEVGPALAEIRDSHLYREEFGTWERYCLAVLGYSKAQAHRLVQASQVRADLSPIGDVLPERESHLRELARLPNKELRQQAWQDVLAKAPEVITAKLVKKSVSEVQKESGLLPKSNGAKQASHRNSTAADSKANDVAAVGCDDSEAVPKEAEEHTGPVATFDLADGTQSEPVLWPSDLFDSEYVESKLSAMRENNQRAPAEIRKDDEEIARRQRLLLGLVQKANLMMTGSPSEVEKGSFYWAAHEFQHMTASMRPVRSQVRAESPCDDADQEGARLAR